MIRVGIAGCGFVAESRHLPALAHVAEARVTAVADLDAAAATRVADRFGIERRHSSPAALVADPEVDLVAVCVPAAAHAEVAVAALDAGKHVLVEKPLALSLEEADAIAAAAARSGAVAQVGFNLRWHRLARRARALVAAGAIGRVDVVASAFTDAHAARPGLPAWRTRRALGGGALLDKAIHHLDLWRFLLDDEIDEAAARESSRDGDDEAVVVSARLRSGALATLVAADRTGTVNDVRLYGTRGAILLDLYRSDGLVQLGVSELPGSPRTRVRRLAQSLAELAANTREVRRGGVFDASYEAQWRHVARAALRQEPPGCTIEDGRRALEAALAAASATAPQLGLVEAT